MKIKNTLVESTPFVVLQITKKGRVTHELRQYWSANSGTYGFQVCAQIWHNGDYSEDKTNGCGYSKAGQVFCNFINDVIGPHTIYGDGADYYLRDYNIGGNYYRISERSLRKLLKSKEG